MRLVPKPPDRGMLIVEKMTADDPGFPAITESEQGSFDRLLNGVDEGSVALMRVRHQGVPRVAICVIESEGDLMNVYPIALMLDTALFEQVDPPPDGDKSAPERVHRNS